MDTFQEPNTERLVASEGLPLAVDFGREICGDLGFAETREWLVTNGIGGFASGTVGGVLTRRYHGLLVAALVPPLGRTLLVTKLEEIASYDGQTIPLSANRWASGAVEPRGYLRLERFRLEGTTPVWTYALGDALLEKRVWMEQGANTTYIEYRIERSSLPISLMVKALVNYRDFHGNTQAGDWRMQVEQAGQGFRIRAFDGAVPFFILCNRGAAQPAHVWYRDFLLAREQERGLDAREDHLHAGTFAVKLSRGESVTIVATTEVETTPEGREPLRRHQQRQRGLLHRWRAASSVADSAPAWVRQLVLAADQFVVRRPVAEVPEAWTILAGYPWFSDWGRDTMIALPGIALATGRPEVARGILRAFARFVDRGMLPNYFPDKGQPPTTNSVDAALWYFEAVRQYLELTHDADFREELFPVLAEIVDWHVRGTRYHIAVDSTDGLLYAGEPGVQLTWMDAKVDDWVVTPRIGKPIEVNALWLNALETMAAFADELGKPAESYRRMAERCRASFARFWNDSAGYCYDVLDGPDGNDTTLRPNQIFAVALPASGLRPDQQRAVVETCARHLLTSYGLRSLAPREPGYCGRYEGSRRERDAAYHQGTVWAWLLGPFALAYERVTGDAASALGFLQPFHSHLTVHGLGTVSEIFDGDPPHTPRGCTAQAWSVGEILRAWTILAGRLKSS